MGFSSPSIKPSVIILSEPWNRETDSMLIEINMLWIVVFQVGLSPDPKYC